MTDIVPYTPTQLAEAPSSTRWVDMLTPVAELARQIANTEFVPAPLRNKPAAVAACVLYGQEIGIGPMQALSKVDIVEGRPAPRAELARALALAAGHELWVEESTTTKVTVAGRRRGSDIIQRATWTMDDAKRAGLDGKQNYRKHPRQMLLARASAELVRMAFPDVLGGIAYFAEELDGDAPDTPTVADTEAPKRNTRRAKPIEATATEPMAATAQTINQAIADAQPEEPPLPGEDEPDTPTLTDAQMKKLRATYGDFGVKTAADMKHISSLILGEQITSHSTLTVDQASTLIDRLEAINIGAWEFVIDTDGTVIGTRASQTEQPELPTESETT